MKILQNGQKEAYFKDIIGKKIEISDDWYVWKINGDFIDVGRITKEYQNSYIGLVYSAKGFIKLLQGEKYPPYYPSF